MASNNTPHNPNQGNMKAFEDMDEATLQQQSFLALQRLKVVAGERNSTYATLALQWADATTHDEYVALMHKVVSAIDEAVILNSEN